MRHSLLGKTLGDSIRSYPWWLGGLVAYVVLITMVYPFLEEQGQAFQDLLENYPAALLAAFGIDPKLSIVSVEGFLGTYVFGWLVPLLFLIFAISFGSRAIAGEEETGTMEILLANPISRARVVLIKYAALVILVTGLSLALFVAVVVGGLFVGWEMNLANIAAACVSGGLLGLAFGGISFGLAAATGRRAATGGITAALAVGSYLLFTVGGLVDSLADVAKASPIWLYAGTETLIEGLIVGRALALLATSVLAIAAAGILFQQRDMRL
jgi:ABC-2 type transport system permease protein